MLVFLQIWGGLFFLLNKVFLSFAERTEKKQDEQKSRWRIWSWIVFLIGIPAWIIIFVREHNWIAAALEAGGIPSMILGLLIAIRKTSKQPQWLHHLALGCIILGLGYSLYDFGGITTWNQVAELFMTTGFLIGTYQLARKKLSGYLWYMLMHIACIAIMILQNYPWLIAQQVISIGFIIDAYRTKKSN